LLIFEAMRRIGLFIRNFIQHFRNKYLVAITVFVLWLVFFDQNNIIDRYKAIRHLNKLKADKEYYQEKIHNDSLRLQELRSNNENLEKFAREQYLMKKDNEDIFLIPK